MPTPSQILFLVLICNYFSSIWLLVHCEALLKSFGNCEQNENYKSKFNLTLKTIGKTQYFDGTWNLTAPLDNNLRTNVSVSMLAGKEYVYLFSANEKKSCEAINKYLGEFWYDFERNAQIIPGLCPIEKGKYRVHDLPLDFNKVTTIRTFPFGNLRISVTVYDGNNDVFTCLLTELELRM